MLLVSTKVDEDEREPLLVLIDCQYQDGGLLVGAAFAKAGITDDTLRMLNPEDGEELTVRVPRDAVGLPVDGWSPDVRMEVVNAQGEEG